MGGRLLVVRACVVGARCVCVYGHQKKWKEMQASRERKINNFLRTTGISNVDYCSCCVMAVAW